MNSDCDEYIRTVSQVTKILQGKWKLHILCAMRNEPVRLSHLTRLIPLASKKALRASLRDLELSRTIVRRDLSDTLLHVEYDFPDNMRETIGTLLDQLARWGVTLENKREALF